MPPFAALMPIIVGLLVFGALVGIPLAVGRRQVRQDRRRIMAEGVSGHVEITQIGRPSRNGSCVLYFSIHPTSAHGGVQGKQRTTRAAVDKLGLSVGSTATVAVPA